MLGLRVFLNTKYANFGLLELDSGVWAPAYGMTQVRNSANSSVLDNFSQLASATAIFLTVFTDEIYQTTLPLFVFI